ncbi:MAG: ABC transporter ATP-binding protein [Azospirillum sp.]|nr:ABC transporter ATP-binding protein [Azospirillum sp.]
MITARGGLELKDVHLRYGDAHALRGISLRVDPGEFVALLGPSGCGKTTLLRSVAGFAHPQSGHIYIGSKDVVSVPPRERNIGLVFQSYALFPHLTALENVCFGLETRGVNVAAARSRANAALELVGLTGFHGRRPIQLSGGQQQRVALARAIVIEPDILLLDEPLAALDRQLRVQMQTELKSLQRKLGVTTVFVTHDQEEALAMADRIVVMRDGRIEQVAPPMQLFAEPSNAWVGEFVGAGNILSGEIVVDDLGPTIMVAPNWRIRLPNGAKPDAGKALFVRAEKIGLRAPLDGECTLRVLAHRFLGVHIEVHLDFSGGTLRALLPPEKAALYPPNSHVAAVIDPGDCRLLTR